jgi:dihydroflavonol-4-reductase
MKALVTGASGFVGSAVARALLGAGWTVRVLIRPTSDRSNLRGLPVEIAVGDLTRADTLAAPLDGCDALFHVAADYRLGAPNPAELYATNVDGTQHLLDAARRAGVRKIVYTSSVATMGIPADGSVGDETTPVTLDAMIGHYKRSKFLAERVVIEAAESGLPAVIVNPSTPVGPGDVKPTPTGALVRDAAQGRMPAYVDTGLNVVHVDDVAAGHVAAFHLGRIGERYVLGGENLTLQQILAQIALYMGRPPPRIKLPYAAVLPIAHASANSIIIRAPPPARSRMPCAGSASSARGLAPAFGQRL